MTLSRSNRPRRIAPLSTRAFAATTAHARAPASVPPAAASRRAPWRMPPVRELPGRHDIDVSVQDERSATRPADLPDHTAAAVPLHLHAEGAMSSHRADVEGPSVHGEARAPHLARHEVLRLLFGSSQAPD